MQGVASIARGYSRIVLAYSVCVGACVVAVARLCTCDARDARCDLQRRESRAFPPPSATWLFPAPQLTRFGTPFLKTRRRNDAVTQL